MRPIIEGILLSLWGISVLGAYLSRRVELATLGLRGLDHLANLFLAAVLIVIFHALGRALARRFSSRTDDRAHTLRSPTGGGWSCDHPFSDVWLATLFYIGLGFGALSLIVFALGLLRLYYTGIGYALLTAGLALAVWDWRYLAVLVRRAQRPIYPSTGLERLLIGLYLVVLGLGLACALAPPTLGDDMVYHLFTPKMYLRHHGIVDIPYNIYTYFPMGAEMLYTLAMLVKGDVPAKLLHYTMGIFISLSVYWVCRQLDLNRRMSLLAMLFFSTVPTVWFLMSWSAYVDLVLTFFLLLSLLAYIGSWNSSRRSWLLLCGVFYGVALSIKFTALYMIPVLLCGLLLRLRRHLAASDAPSGSVLRSIAGQVFLPMATALLLAGPWYLKNLYQTGNPFFPFFLDLVRVSHPGWDADRAANYMVMLGHYGRDVKAWWSYFMLPWDLTMHARLIDPRAFDGIVGPVFLMILPLFFLRRALPAAVRILSGFVLIYFFAWALSSQQVRFLVPMMPALSVLSAFALTVGPSSRPARRVPWRRLMVALVALAVLVNTMVIGFYFTRVNPLPYLFGQESRDQYLSQRLDYYDLYQYMNRALPPASKVFLIDMGNFGYYLERDFFSDSIFEDHTIQRIVDQSRTGAEIRARLRGMEITHLVYCRSILFNPSLAPLGPAGQSRFVRFLEQYGRLLKGDANFQLWEIKYD